LALEAAEEAFILALEDLVITVTHTAIMAIHTDAIAPLTDAIEDTGALIARDSTEAEDFIAGQEVIEAIITGEVDEEEEEDRFI